MTLELMSLGKVHGQTIRSEDLSGTLWARIRDLDTGEIRRIPVNIVDGPGVRRAHIHSALREALRNANVFPAFGRVDRDGEVILAF